MGYLGRSRVRLALSLAFVCAAVFLLASCATQTKTPAAKPSPVTPSTTSRTPDSPASNITDHTPKKSLDAGMPQAPPFPAGLTWLNTSAPLTMKELRGKVVLLDFWTYGCINCMHDIPWIKKIQAAFPDTLVVIGVHSAKFTHSSVTKNIRETIRRFRLTYPIVNDDHFEVWNEYGVNAWPTLALIDPVGRVVGWHVGEGFYPLFKPEIEKLIAEFSKEGLIDRKPLAMKLATQGLPQTVLAFPGKVRVDAKHNRMFIADTGHNRILVAGLATGRVEAVIGSGKQGAADGGYAQAEFNQPEGMAYAPDGKTLYVADTGNNDIRAVNLATKQVTTLVGTGKQAADYPPVPGTAPEVALNSPWDLALDGSTLFVAMAGSHQIWSVNLATKRVAAYAGTGAEGSDDGSLAASDMAQPSGLSLSADGKRLYFTNSEGSSVRYVDLVAGKVVTLAGPTGSLFDYGNRNGIGQFARFQHPLGIVAYQGVVYVADTYNGEIKAVNPVTGAVKTIGGGPSSGWRDGKNPLFYEPSGLDAANGKLYIADTDNNSIRVMDLATGETSTVVLTGLEQFAGLQDVYGVKTVKLEPLTVPAGAGSVRLQVSFPAGYEPNAQAPSQISLHAGSPSVIALTGKDSFGGAGPSFPMSFSAHFRPGATTLTIDLSVVYCQDQKAKVCLIHQAKLEIPVTVYAGAGAAGAAKGSKAGPVLKVTYKVE